MLYRVWEYRGEAAGHSTFHRLYDIDEKSAAMFILGGETWEERKCTNATYRWPDGTYGVCRDNPCHVCGNVGKYRLFRIVRPWGASTE